MAAEVAEILAPWRPQKLRRIAAVHLGLAGFRARPRPHFYILRTHYGGGAADGARLRSWLDQGADVGPDIALDEKWFSVLGDIELFGFRDCWQAVYGVLPELAAPKPDRRFTDQDVEWAQEFAADLVETKPDESEEEHYADATRQVAAADGPPWLIVVDEEAFSAEDLGLIFRDKRVTRSRRLKSGSTCLVTFTSGRKGV
ncbi:hypothetical protein N658DRAFT_500813 [Parathielavia hyrcaniae]|uniref:Uncharacterized protein n=1 Tax=Parathielavia hyrcaniae TaxID=113614 RepID=A0AAN6SX57_9PEZI|nr:hypothetical protein N658DRAFT_500813 [Parathielavia hyrcaniae]